ncbi:DUF4232 domain-containing protein [Jatrophihabitans sp.]|uniref:DUF4232 domain-containing protein n=1 Tax=Jatrophihabitans sp. TaxID=1932789 RepID=UPI0030C73FF8|nr:hypothetical protein [Jatrophihabitans sp.]
MNNALRLSALGLAVAAGLACAACTSSSGGTGSGSGSPSSPGGTSTAATSGTSGTASGMPTSAVSSGSTTAGTRTSGAATGGTTPPGPGVSTPAALAHPQWCVDGEITTTAQHSPDGGAAGHNGVLLVFTNSSTRTCVLYGYPGADALDAAGHPVAHAARSLTGYIGGTYSGLHNVSLTPGSSASTYVEGDIGDGGAACSSGTTMVVTPPNLFHSTPVPLSPYVCAFTIHPVVAGSTGR